MGTFIAQCLVLLCIVKCYGRAQWLATPHRQRPLPTVIITREHLLREQQQKSPSPSLYGAAHGQTAAEFVVSAGIGPSKQSTAVRVRKLPNTPIKSNASNEISRHAYHGPNRRQDGRIEFRNNSPTYGRDIPRYIPPIFVPRYQPGSNQGQPHRNNPTAYKPEFSNRYDGDHRIRYGVNPVRKPEHHTNRYNQHQPASFNPANYKPDYNVRRGDHLNPVAYSPDLTIRVPEKNKQLIHKPDSYPRIEINDRREYNGETPGHYVVKPNQDHRKPIITSSNGYKPIISPPTRRVIITTVSSKPDMSTEEGNFSDRKIVEATSSPIEILPKESKEQNKDVVAETPVLKLNSGKADKIPNIIRRPSLVLRDQIIVNELPEASTRERYGPRSLERRKRETEEIPLSNEDKNVSTSFNDSKEQKLLSRRMDDRNDDSSEIKGIKRYTGYWNPQRKSSMNMSAEATVKISSFRPVFDEYEDDHSSIEDEIQPKPSPIAKKILKNYRTPQRNTSPEDSSSKKKPKDATRTSRNHPIRQLYDNHRSNSSSKNSTTPSVMSFSEFLASPVAEKIRLERQSHFRDSNSTEDTANSTARYSYHGNPLWKPSMLRELLASRLLHGMLSKNTSSTRRTPIPDEAEQRHYGVVISPYEGLGSNVMPVIKVLRGRIVPLPELPQELIPLLLDNYRPPASSQDEEGAALDRAILSLLQSDEFAEKDRDLRYKFNRKSPSTNHVGSVKINEGYNRYYKPADWSLGPRCDRLTEEICLDDSDYPSSAILSSIQKDQARFELMYAEAKRSSPREGPPREHSVCPSEVHLARPHRARNKAGQWKVVVNVDRYTQTIRMEKCLDHGNPCPFVSSRVQPTCTQLYAHHRMLVFSKERGLHIDLFRVPTACACRIQPPAESASNHYYNVMRHSGDEFGGHVETAPPSTHSRMPEGSASKKNLSSTLWSILGGGPKGGALAQQPQFLDEVQKQVAWTNRLPNISPSQVLKQLLDEDEEYGIRRQRLRPKPIPSNTVGHSLATPIAIPRPPSHPMNGIHRRPVVGPADRLFGMPAVKVSLTRDGPPAAVLQEVKAYKVSNGPSPFRPPQADQEVKAYKISTAFQRSPQSNDNIRSDDDVEIKAYEISSNPAPLIDEGDGEVHDGMEEYRPQRTDTEMEEEVDDYKVKPGMFHTPDGDRQWNEDGPSRFEENSKGGPIMKPLPMGADEEDLLAVEKSEGKHPIKVETTTEDNDEETFDDDDTRINFSYHPILEYLNF